MKDIKELTGIRFFAAIHVVIFHQFFLVGSFGTSLPSWLRSIISFGDFAVSFFFILSGFILSCVYVGSEKNLIKSNGSFWFARFSRIYPMYLLGFVLDLPRGLDYFFSTYSSSIVATSKVIVSASSHLLMVQSWYPRLTPVWNSPAWSLSAEMFFYFIFPLIAPIIFKLRKDIICILILYLTPIISYIVLVKFLNQDLNEASNSVFWRSFPLLRSIEFLLGIFLGKFYLREGSFKTWMKLNPGLIGFLFWLSTLLSLFLISIHSNFPREILANTFMVPLFSFMIFSLAVVKIPFTKFLRSRLILLLGGASYALYIVHVPMLYYVKMMLEMFNLSYGLEYMAIYLLIVISLSIFLYLKIERPIQAWLRKSFKYS